MKRLKRLSFLQGLIILLLSAEISMIFDCIAVLTDHYMPYLLFFAAFAATVIILVLIWMRYEKAAAAYTKLSVILPVICLILFLITMLLWFAFRGNIRYIDFSEYQTFNGKSAMVIVPHQDDDICVAGGVIEKFIAEGGEVRVVFATNGDYKGRDNGERRLNEAIAALAKCNVRQENIIFLGYGDSFYLAGPDIYHAEPDELLVSHCGLTGTYALSGHPPFAFSDYTRNNFKNDLKNVILKYRPDVIFCSDMDYHFDHKALSMMFEEVMGDILRENGDYTPLVFKGFSYSTAYFAAEDFYSENIISTIDPEGGEGTPDRPDYKWEDRVRFPVEAGTLSRCLRDCTEYEALSEYESAMADLHAQAVINGDKVYWQRETGSLCYNASFSASSGDISCLNDFKTYDVSSFADGDENVCGVWIPDDDRKSFTVTFNAAADIEYICVYDNISEADNVLNAEITLDNGNVIESGALDPCGGKTRIDIRQENVQSLTFKITATQGDAAGITEFEAFSREQVPEISFIKIMNLNGDFIYDYYIHPDGEETFELYSYGCSSRIDDYSLSCDGDDGCSAEIKDGKLLVTCPKGSSCFVTLKGNGTVESVRISNPTAFVREFYQIDRFLYRKRHFIIELTPYRFLKEIYHHFVPLVE